MDQMAGRGRIMTLDEINVFLRKHFPQIGPGNDLKLESIGPMCSVMRLVQQEKHLRPGGTISGPSMFGLADVAIYVAILGEIGVGADIEQAHMSAGAQAVTTNLNINFLRKPAARDLIAEAQLMKVGRRLAVGEAWLRSEGMDDPVAHAVGTYSIPG